MKNADINLLTNRPTAKSKLKQTYIAQACVKKKINNAF